MEVTTYRTHMEGPLTTLSIEKGAAIVTMLFDVPGCHTRLHSHTFDHWMEVVQGSVRIQLGAEASVKHAGDRYLVVAGVQHSVVPLTLDAVVRCVHEHADIDPANAGAGVPLEWITRLTEKGSYAGS